MFVAGEYQNETRSGKFVYKYGVDQKHTKMFSVRPNASIIF
jgi:hypothetical protein